MNRKQHQDAHLAPLRSLPASALRAVLRDGYGREKFKQDLMAGLVVGVIALPLAMALAIGVGVPPQHGLYTAIIAGLVIALLGGSRMQVSGPTAAFIVVLAPIYSRFGLRGLLLSGLMGGAMLIAMGVLRFGRLIQFIPHPVTTGFTAGIATVIATLQLKDVLGLSVPRDSPHFLEKVGILAGSLGTASPWEALVAAFTLAALLLTPRITRRVPAPLIALPLAALLAFLLSRFVPGVELATIANRFQIEIGGKTVMGIPQLPPLPMAPWAAPASETWSFNFETLRALAAGGFAIAILGAIESLLSAVVADGMAHTKHDPDSELLAQGVGNLLLPFFGGIPATGAIARTAANVRAGAVSPIAAALHALVVLAAVLALAPLLGYLPMAGLAALLLVVAWNMSEARHFVHTLRVAPKSDVTVLLTCYALTVSFDMVVGVSVGMVLAALLFMRRMAEVVHTRLSQRVPEAPEPAPEGVLFYQISGPLFFGAAQKAMATLESIGKQARVVILILNEVHAMDATGEVALESVLRHLREQRCKVVLTGVCPQPLLVLKKAHLEEQPGVYFSDTVAEALEIARGELEREPVLKSRPAWLGSTDGP